ncbi:MAG: serine/threonine protein kinase [Verrucomicrobiales bacterium]|nr:serine/threonine protein kinase [Verrucomicrobiales bacterium]
MPDNFQIYSHRCALLAQGLTDVSEIPEPEIQGYEIKKRLGHGGMSIVYLARETALNRMVALKVFNIEGIDDVSHERFQQEALMTASIQHPNIVSIYRLLTDDNETPCLVLEYISGGSVRSKLTAQKRIDLEMTLQIAIDVCRGLAELHSRSIVHRDIKPENILLTEEGVAKVADLGISLNKKLDESAPSLTMTGTFVGTIAYLSPEQTTKSREGIDARSDIWAIGILITEMLIGSPPHAILISDLLQNIPSTLKPIIKKCLRHNPDDRYASIDQLLTDLVHIQKPKKLRILFCTAFGILAASALIFFLPLYEPNPLTQQDLAQKKNETKLSPDEWVDLIPLLPSPLKPIRGVWSLTDGTLTCQSESQEACMVLMSEPIGENYDLTLNFIRVTNQDSIIVYLPTSIGMLDFHIDAWRQHLSGIQNLDHENMRKHGETFPFTIINRKLYKLRIEVRSQSIEAKINGKSYYTWDLTGKHGSLHSHVKAFTDQRIGLGAWESTTQFMDVRIRQVRK